MKGDDVLLVNERKIILGESKFRSAPSKSSIKEAAKLMNNKIALPLSLGFVADRLSDQGQDELADMILDIQYQMSKTVFDIKNIAFILSTKNIKEYVENNMDSTNSEFAFISLGIDNPVEFMELAYARAEELLMEESRDGD